MTLSDLLALVQAPEAHDDGFLAHCPAHADSEASLRIAIGKDGDKVILKCRAGCETSAVLDAVGLTIRDLATMTVDDAARRVKPATSTSDPAPANSVAALAADLDRYAAALSHPTAGDSRQVLNYAEERFRMYPDDVERLGLGYWDDNGTARLVVPFRDLDGVPMGHQARAIDPSVDLRWKGPKAPKGGSWSKIGFLPGSSGWAEVIITEGPGDGVTAASLGWDAILVAGAANARNPRVVDDIAAMVGTRKAIVAGDGDRAGGEFATALAAGLIERGVTVAILDVPAGEDLTSWREKDPTGRAIVRAVQEAPLQSSFSSAARERDADLYPLTDLGNARFLRDYALTRGSALRYSPEAGFFVLDGGVWRPDDLDAARAYSQEAAEVTADIAERMRRGAGDEGAAKAAATVWSRWAAYSQSSKGIDAALREVKALRDVATALEAFDQRPDLLAVRNGVVDLRSGTLLKHDPTYLLTRRIDLDFNPRAQAPRWEKYLTEVFPKYRDLPAYMRRLVGYGITGRTDEQCFAVLWGKGANGKSVFTDTLTEVFREATVTTPFSTFEARPSGGIPNDIAALKGARLVMASEGEANKPMAEAMLKRVTGRDLISARFMRKEFFEFRPTFLLMLATNAKPQFRGQDEGLWRRVKLIPWERYFAPHERDPRLTADLLAEGPGILAWAVRGAVEWYASGLGDPPAVIDATKDYRETSNALDGFLPGEFVIDPEASGMSLSHLYETYREWADTEGLQQREVWTKRTFSAALEERSLTKRKTNAGVVFDGLREVKPADRKAAAEEPGAEEAPLALSSPDTTPAPVGGASLDAL